MLFFLILLIIALGFLWLLPIYFGYNWFILYAFPSLPSIDLTQAYALSIIIVLLNRHYSTEEESSIGPFLTPIMVMGYFCLIKFVFFYI